jgi:hypothetical protein
METRRVLGVACAVCVALAACPLGRAQASGGSGREQMARGLDQLHRSSSTCVGCVVRGVPARCGSRQAHTRALLHAYACLPHRAGDGIAPAERVGFVSAFPGTARYRLEHTASGRSSPARMAPRLQTTLTEAKPHLTDVLLACSGPWTPGHDNDLLRPVTSVRAYAPGRY